MEPQVILVDEQDQPIGQAGKMEAHLTPQLHRAFSVLVFDSSGRVLIHKRAAGKYHSAGLWSNTCCSHPAPGQDLVEAAQTRLQYEMGFSTVLTVLGSFIYREDFSNGLTEYEFDHVLYGLWEGYPQFNPEEAESIAWIHLAHLQKLVRENSSLFTAWLPMILKTVLQSMLLHNKPWLCTPPTKLTSHDSDILFADM